MQAMGCREVGLERAAFEAVPLLRAPEIAATIAWTQGAVAEALQRRLLELPLEDLSAQDLCHALVGLANGTVVPETAAKLALLMKHRGHELSLRSLLDFARALATLLRLLEGSERAVVAESFKETLPRLAAAMDSADGLVLTGLSRVAASLPEESQEALAFAKAVVAPQVEVLLEELRQDEKMECLELSAPLLHLDKEGYSKLLEYLARDGLRRLEPHRVLSMLEWVLEKNNSSASSSSLCPPFFDFGLQELATRDLTSTDTRRLARLSAQAPLVRPDILPVQALETVVENLEELALHLAGLAEVYLRLREEGQEARAAAVVQILEASAQRAPELLTPETCQSNAAFLGLSAFAQAACRYEAGAQQRLLLAGLQYLDVLCRARSASASGEPLSFQQAHIFATCLRGFCLGKEPLPAPAASLELLEDVMKDMRSRETKEAKLCLAMLEELRADPRCPPLLREASAQDRLRKSMAEAPVQKAPANLLRRIFGL